jgi:hypothetical protein
VRVAVRDKSLIIRRGEGSEGCFGIM